MISWLMDRLSDRVNHGYWYAPDPHSITNNHYGQWGQPKDNNMALNNMANLQGLQGFQGATICCGSSGGGLGGITNVLSNTTGSIPWLSYIGNTNSHTIIAFTDANGSVWPLAVDQAFIPTMTQISQAHQMKAANGQVGTQVGTQQAPPPCNPDMPKSLPMLEGDFTEGEMELAETIIEELKSGEKKCRHAQDIQEDICYPS